jgi:hypothetical protein
MHISAPLYFHKEYDVINIQIRSVRGSSQKADDDKFA